MAMSKQEKDLHKEFVKHLLGIKKGSYVDLFEIELTQIIEGISSHLPPPHQTHHITLNKYIIICT